MSSKRTLFIVPLATGIFTAATATEILDPLIVSSRGLDESASEVPYTSTTVTEDFINDNLSRTIPDALQLTPGVMVQKTAYGNGSPYIRGFTGRQNLLLIDGVRFNNSAFRGGPVQYWNTVDPYSIQRLELTKSQGSVLYGSDAIGGSMNAVTKSSGFQDIASGQQFIHGLGSYQFRSNGDDSHIGRLETSFGIGGKFGVSLGVTAKDFGDVRDAAVGRMQNTGYPEQDVDLKAEWAANDSLVFTFLHQYVNQDDIWRWHSTSFNPGWTHGSHVAAPGSFRSRIYDEERSLTYLRADGLGQGQYLDSWSATLSFQRFNDSETQDRGSPTKTDIRQQSAQVETYGLDLRFNSPLAGGTLVYGVNYYRDEIASTAFQDSGSGLSFNPANRPLADNSSYDLFGAFVQDVREVLPGLELTSGVRFTYANAELGKFYDEANQIDGLSADDHWTDLSASVRALYKIDSCWSIYGGLSQAFRAPNLDDLSGNKTARSGMNSSGSIGVDPEQFLTYEIGVRRVNESTSFNAAVFYTDGEDVIGGVPIANGSNQSVTTNSQESYVYGIEVEGGWAFADQWLLSGFVAWQDGRSETELFVGGPSSEETVSRLLPLSGSVALRWTSPSDRYWIEGRILSSARQDRLTAGDIGDNQRIPSGGTPGYTVVMLHSGIRLQEHANLRLGLENVLDEDYRIHGSGLNEPGMNAVVGLELTF